MPDLHPLRLERADWLPRATAHAARVEEWTRPHLARRSRGEKHPVHDFLFDYYSHRPGALRRWHPGAGVVLLDAPEYADLKGYAATGGRAASAGERVETQARPTSGRAASAGERVETQVRPTGGRAASAGERVETQARPTGGRAASAGERVETQARPTGGRAASAGERVETQVRPTGGRAASAGERVETQVSEDYLSAQQPLLRQVRGLLVATARRPAMTGCFGLHEWAMVHGAGHDGTRHDVPLRLGPDGTDRVVESHRIACSHFDAFRFFTPTARPLNTLSPGADDRADFEQPGCLHAGMDLYKHAFRLSPLVPGELVADCFALALEIRELDMRASPYDLSAWGYEPVRIETAAGKQEYAAAQRGFAERGAPLRQRLIEECERLMTAATGRSAAKAAEPAR